MIAVKKLTTKLGVAHNLAFAFQSREINMRKFFAMAAVYVWALSANVSAGQDGQDVYVKACTVCHSMGVAGAPKTHDGIAWEPRLALGIDTLVATVKTGKGAIPPGGMCTDCTDEDYKKAIEFMSK